MLGDKRDLLYLQSTTGGNRIAKYHKYSKNAGLVKGSGDQVHHLIPDNVVQSHELADEARLRAGYDLDLKTNLLLAPRTKARYNSSALKIKHAGSHPKWDRHVENVLDQYQNVLEMKYGSLDRVPKKSF